MTYDDITYQVDLIAGEPLDDAGLLIASANHGLREIFRALRITNTVSLYTHGLQPSIYIKEIHCDSGQAVTIPVKGLSYSMRIHGAGRILFHSEEDGDTVERFETGRDPILKKGLLGTVSSITIWGSLVFSVYDFAIYDRLYSSVPEELPVYSSTTVFDMRKLYPDFMSFLTPARDHDGNMIKGCLLRNGQIIVDSAYQGEIIITYRRLPTRIRGIDAEDIDIPEEYSQLLPLITAYYVLMRKDEVTAKECRALFEKQLEQLPKIGYEQIDTSYVLTNSWA